MKVRPLDVTLTLFMRAEWSPDVCIVITVCILCFLLLICSPMGVVIGCIGGHLYYFRQVVYTAGNPDARPTRAPALLYRLLGYRQIADTAFKAFVPAERRQYERDHADRADYRWGEGVVLGGTY